MKVFGQEHFMNKVVIYSLPKMGLHLLSDVVCLMLSKEINIFDKDEMYAIIPHSKVMLEREIFSTHPKYIPYKEAQFNVLSCVRNPLDTLISEWFFYETRKKLQREIFEFSEELLPKRIKQIEHHLEFVERKGNSSTFVRFEDLSGNKKIETIREIYNFLIVRGFVLEVLDEELILEKTENARVQQEEKKNGLYKVGEVQIHPFHRSGRTGQWKEHFTEEQINQLRKEIEKSKKITKLFPEVFE
jgi:hypothetical protein